MKKVLYISNIEVPYRVRFFNELAQYCDLTVLYERACSSTRNRTWATSENPKHSVKYLGGISLNGENSFSLKVIHEIRKGYDTIIVGCFNSPVQILAMLYMRIAQIPFIMNLDGETYLEGNGIKARLKRFFISGAEKYLVAGEKAAESIKAVTKGKQVIPYYFSSLSEAEIHEHYLHSLTEKRNDKILVVGQYFDCKGMDVALKAAQMDTSLQYKFVGMGNRTDKFLQDYAGQISDNVEIIPFLQRAELEKEYQTCGMLLLPSRKECWGLVINEAASFGMPIVSTWGSGAAVEFLGDKFARYLAEPGNVTDLYSKIVSLQSEKEKIGYSNYLLENSERYTIERNVREHLRAFEIVSGEN